MRFKSVFSALATLAVAAVVVPVASAVAHEADQSPERRSWSATDTYWVVADGCKNCDHELKRQPTFLVPASGDYRVRVDDDNWDVAHIRVRSGPDGDRVEVFDGCVRSGKSINVDSLPQGELQVNVGPGNDCSLPLISFLDLSVNDHPSTGTVTLSWRPEGHLNRLYRAAFLRGPDQEGFNYWLGRLEGGESLEAVADAFGDTDEFRQRFEGLDAAGFVDRAHLNVFGRHPDSEDRHRWVHELRHHQLTRIRLILQFTDWL